MNLDKAIEIESIHNDHNPNFTDAEREEAHQIGIQAMKRIQYQRTMAAPINQPPLKGETLG